MKTATASDLAAALRNGEEVSFEIAARPPVFRWECDGSYGRTQVQANVIEMRGLIEQAVRLAFRPTDAELADEVAGVRTWLNTLIDRAEAEHPLGEIISRRVIERESAGFLGTGAGAYEQHQVLVRLAADWDDQRGAFLVERKAGEEVWMDNCKPLERV